MLESRETISGYEILDPLGRTTWGDSFLARQLSLDRLVHLTVLPPEKDAPAIHEKARRCATLTHPHLVSGIDLGAEAGRTFFVTEWAEGPTVGDIVRRGGTIAEERAIEIALAAALALGHAASAGIGHGRITPEAIMIVAGGNPKLRGFGPDAGATVSEHDWRAPEVKLDGRATKRSDIYSLGAVLYWMLSGQHPFANAPLPAVVDGVVVELPVPLGQANRRLCPDTCNLVESTMAWAPEERPPSAAALSEAMETLLTRLDERIDLKSPRGGRPKARRPRPPRIRRRRPR